MDQSTRRGQPGRPDKDESLSLRDRCVALALGARRGPRSFARLERELQRGFGASGGVRKSGEGRWQQGAWSKRARGARGISDQIGDLPPDIVTAERSYPGIRELYESALWSALWCAGDWSARWRQVQWRLPPTLRTLLDSPGTQRSAQPVLSPQELRALADVAHPDVLGWLLLHTVWFPHGDLGRLACELARQAFFELVRQDPAFAALREPLAQLVQVRFPLVSLAPQPPSAPAAGSHEVQQRSATKPQRTLRAQRTGPPRARLQQTVGPSAAMRNRALNIRYRPLPWASRLAGRGTARP